MFLTMKLRIYPTKKMLEKIDFNLKAARNIYNHYLEYYQKTNVTDLNTMLEDFEKKAARQKFSNEVIYIGKEAIKDLCIALARFKKGIANAPKPRVKNKNDSYRIKNSFNYPIRIYKNRVFMKDLGDVKARFKFDGTSPNFRIVSITKKNNKYYVSLAYEQKEAELKKPVKLVAIDIGTRKVVTTSDGKYFISSEDFYYSDQKIKKLHQKLSACTKGSNNYEKAKLRLAKEYEHQYNIMNDLIHKVTTYLCTNYDVIIMENIDYTQLTSIQDIPYLKRKLIHFGLSKIESYLEYKAKKYGCRIIKVDRYFRSSHICSNCGKEYEVGSSEEFNCPYCGLKIDRDLNAALNLLAEGKKILNS